MNTFTDILREFGIEEKVSEPKSSIILADLRLPQILSIMTDNASANNMIITELVKILPGFPGQANQTHCFTHIINLVAKSLMKLFEVKKKSEEEILTKVEQNLQCLTDEIDMEDLETQIKMYQDSRLGAEEVDDNDDIFDEISEMDEYEATEFQDEILPIWLMLVKVRNIDKLQ